MPLYPKKVARCEHIKVNGTQCGSPALRQQPYCHFHAICHRQGKDAIMYLEELETAMLPTLEDANSVQLGLAGVMRQLVQRQIDHKTAALMLYALQTASANMKRTSFEPEPTLVVIDRECVKERPIGATAWSKVEGREYDDLEKPDLEKANSARPDSAKDAVDPEEAERSRRFGEDYKHLVDGLARDPKFLDRRESDFRAKPQGSSPGAGAGTAPTTERWSGG
jgi:hypothetical protein